MIRRIAQLVVLVPLAIVMILFAVANRQIVTVSLDPFGADPPAFAVTAPLFVIVLLTLMTGVIAGGVASWFSQRKWRRAAKHYEADVRRLAAELQVRDRADGSEALPRLSSPHTL